MLKRKVLPYIQDSLKRQAAVALIGPRQVGKTTIALDLASELDALYLDLENPEDIAKLTDPVLFLETQKDKLVILDEIHRVPEIFQPLRGLIDRGRREGKGVGRFLLLGSASIDLLKQSGESLAGRIAYVDMSPLNVLEIDTGEAVDSLWFRGGFPDSYLAANDNHSVDWRKDFVRTYLERDIPMFGPRLPSETIGRLWTMLAHNQGQLLNSSNLSKSLAIDSRSTNRYIDLLADLLLVRRLQPFHSNISKRLVKSPKTYIRDSGLLHTLLGINHYDDLFGHPIVGMSWEGFVIENLLSAAPRNTQVSFYRTHAGAEIDLLIELGGSNGTWAIEIKKGLVPKVSKGFYQALEDIKPKKAFIVYSGEDSYPIAENIEVISLKQLASKLEELA